MAGLDGVEAARKIRAHRPETRVVAFTGLDDEDTVQRMLEAGAASFVVKGAPLWELERALQGASQPLLRLAHTLARTLGEQSAIGFLAREPSELTGAALAAVYLSSEPELVPAGAGRARRWTRSRTRGRARRRASFGARTERRGPLLPAAAS